jgi:hypothetical protein
MNTDPDARSNAEWEIEEARRQIDHQLTTASEIDSRALGLLVFSAERLGCSASSPT